MDIDTSVDHSAFVALDDFAVRNNVVDMHAGTLYGLLNVLSVSPDAILSYADGVALSADGHEVRHVLSPLSVRDCGQGGSETGATRGLRSESTATSARRRGAHPRWPGEPPRWPRWGEGRGSG